jgi:hypothetical protein
VIDEDKENVSFIMDDASAYDMYHPQDCCEQVYLDDVVGGLKDIMGYPVLSAYESSSEVEPEDPHDDSSTWTFYNISTIKGSVTLRWLGTSNGYYSERVGFFKINSKKEDI